MSISIATWNLNNRAGKVRFKTGAADAAMALDADVFVLTEYYPQDQHEPFVRALTAGGWTNQTLSLVGQTLPEPANRVLIASRIGGGCTDVDLPTFDLQFPANICGFRLPNGLELLGVRVPYYKGLLTEGRATRRGRSSSLRRTALALAQGRCTACERDFDSYLDGLGRSVLHVHHRKQLAAHDMPTLTTVSDLAVVCANCHAILHTDLHQAMKVETLRALIRADRGERD